MLFIDYAVLCDKGKVRVKNQDNFWCQGSYLGQDNAGLRIPIAGSAEIGKHPTFAIFDGMGGECFGEVAAYIAAKTFDACFPTIHIGNKEFDLADTFFKMNKAICDYSVSCNVIGHMGSTAALVMFKGNKVWIGNIGDSRVYLFRDGLLRQVSQDHTSNIAHYAKPPLSQHLGIPEEEFVIAPYITGFTYKNYDQYLLCSDGLTDMVSLEEMEKTMRDCQNVKDGVVKLMETAMAGGGTDNITIIICETRKTGWYLK